MARLGLVNIGRRDRALIPLRAKGASAGRVGDLTIERSWIVNGRGEVWNDAGAAARPRLDLDGLRRFGAAIGGTRTQMSLGAGILLWLPPFMGVSVGIRVLIGSTCGAAF